MAVMSFYSKIYLSSDLTRSSYRVTALAEANSVSGSRKMVGKVSGTLEILSSKRDNAPSMRR